MAVSGIVESQKDLENMLNPMGLGSCFNVPTSIHAKNCGLEIEDDKDKRIQALQADGFISDANPTPARALSNIISGISSG